MIKVGRAKAIPTPYYSEQMKDNPFLGSRGRPLLVNVDLITHNRRRRSSFSPFKCTKRAYFKVRAKMTRALK